MQKGRVVETGNHEELIKKGGEYYHMFTTSEQLPLNEELQVDGMMLLYNRSFRLKYIEIEANSFY